MSLIFSQEDFSTGRCLERAFNSCPSNSQILSNAACVIANLATSEEDQVSQIFTCRVFLATDLNVFFFLSFLGGFLLPEDLWSNANEAAFNLHDVNHYKLLMAVFENLFFFFYFFDITNLCLFKSVIIWFKRFYLGNRFGLKLSLRRVVYKGFSHDTLCHPVWMITSLIEATSSNNQNTFGFKTKN